MIKKALAGAICMIGLSGLAMAGPADKPTLEPVQKQELLRLEETWNVLDQVAARGLARLEGLCRRPFPL